MKIANCLGYCLAVLASLLMSNAVVGAETSFSVATFVADVTPPVGHPLQAGVGVKPVAAVVDPLLAHEKVRVAYALSWRMRVDAGQALDLPVIEFGVAQLLLLPGEPFVEYQLFARQQRPDGFVMTLGYGDYGPVYLPTDRAFDEGGYEPGAWSFVARGVEKALKNAITQGLNRHR